jgi:hypothetical protein
VKNGYIGRVKHLYKLGKNKEFKDTLEELSKKRSYYGFLSSHIIEKSR